MRERVLQTLYRWFPFDLRGDCTVPAASDGMTLSCVINFYGRINLLEGILYSLQDQDISRDRLEIVLVEDQGGTEAGRLAAEQFSPKLPIRYLPLDANFGRMGYSRNFGLAHSRGKYVLFLDDDTVLQQGDFLSKLVDVFESIPEADALVPHGAAAYSLIDDRYDFHDPYFMTSRCTAYRRSVLAELGGFVSNFIGQEDVEFVVRFTIAGKKYRQVPELHYFHPPLMVPNFRKPMAVGYSFSMLKSRYPMLLWLLVVLNCARHAPLYLLPVRRFREMGRFGIGFLAGVVAALFKKEGFKYS
ncbi:MAG: glycosyltransferase family A protein [Desulfuromonadaceae bacterium]|nr:glycosyltransferase family A protein [Desulfuromonadaceae bacterium]MDD2847016.1 glycosyltransferase family A protein [Desulfuromonadaceae bacterium]MDD4129006.1 glycosyltransferase family A protein [Desulfuromonadaceae bacterium]